MGELLRTIDRGGKTRERTTAAFEDPESGTEGRQKLGCEVRRRCQSPQRRESNVGTMFLSGIGGKFLRDQQVTTEKLGGKEVDAGGGIKEAENRTIMGRE